ncbi:lisH domain-containing FOPNL isoform X2 [Pelobates cultripes]|uniref:Centrosomal protein 20 n=1 Tax=Pelobates cultripes TaxID=61616 RepID=A0AAD1STU3_PELCU|nr:lisH domain-containing FOPNL isoform X2 [Pelobates cultripes]
MASVDELKAVLKDTLEKGGVIGELKANVRAAVFQAVDDRSEPKPTLSHENLLINELIREYLEFNKYKYSASVLNAEAGLSEIPLDRSFIARELNIIEDGNSQSVPILYGILAHFLQGQVQRKRFENSKEQHLKDANQERICLPQSSTSDAYAYRNMNR